MTVDDDRDLARTLERLANDRDDEGAWRSLFDQIWPFAVGVAFRRLQGQGRLAEEAAQETFIRLVRFANFSVLREPSRFRSFVATTASRAAIDAIRSEASRSAEQELESIGDFPDPEQRSEQLELDLVLRAALQTLGEEDRRLVKLLVRGYSLREIAGRLGIRYSAAGVRVHRLRARLLRHPAWKAVRSIEPNRWKPS